MPDEPIGGEGAGGDPAAAPEAQGAVPAVPLGTGQTLLSGVQGEAAPPIIPPAPKSKYVNDDGTMPEEWYTNLTEPALKERKDLGRYKKIDDVVKSLIESQSLLGKRVDRIAIPKPDDPPEKWAEYRKQTGAPETALGYGELRPDTIPKEAWDTTLESEIRETSHKWGAPPGLVKELAEKYTARQMALAGEAQRLEQVELQKGHDALRVKWGDDVPRQLAYAHQAAVATGLPTDHPMFKDPVVIEAFARIYEMGFAGDRKVNGSLPGAGGIDDRITEVRASPAYKGKEGPDAEKRAQAALHGLLTAQKQARERMGV